MDIGYVVLIVLLMVGTFFAIRWLFPAPQMICTRCEGTGSVDEKWPDPSKPGGWHILHGKCPKCDGKGKVRAG